MSEQTEKRTNGKGIKEEVVHEYPAVGKYRVRLLRGSARRGGGTIVDVREFVSSDTFEGFTRRGVRFASADELHRMMDVLGDALARGSFDAAPAPSGGNGAA